MFTCVEVNFATIRLHEDKCLCATEVSAYIVAANEAHTVCQAFNIDNLKILSARVTNSERVLCVATFNQRVKLHERVLVYDVLIGELRFCTVTF